MQVKLPLVMSFLSVAEMRSFRRAAEVLNTTQPNISGRISELEAMIGEPLFHRTGKNVALTHRGQMLLVHAERLREAHRAFEFQAGLESEEAGTLRVSTSESLVSPFLIVFLQRFAETFPKVAIDLQIESTGNQRRELLERRVDLSLLMGPISHHSVTNAPLLSLPVIWVASASHPLVNKTNIGPCELKESPIITFSKESRPYRQLIKRLRARGIGDARIFSSNSLNASLDMAKAVNGFCTVPKDYVRPHLGRGDFVELETGIDLAPLTFTASYHEDSGSALVAKASRLACSIAEEVSEHQVL